MVYGLWCFFNTTFNISVISWRSVLLLEETGIPGENHWPVAGSLGYKDYYRMLWAYNDLLYFTEIQERFEYLDTDHNGLLTKDEVMTLLREIGSNPTDDDITELFKEMDTDSKHTILKL